MCCIMLIVFVFSVRYKSQRVFSNHTHSSMFTDILRSLLNNRLADKYVPSYKHCCFAVLYYAKHVLILVHMTLTSVQTTLTGLISFYPF